VGIGAAGATAGFSVEGETDESGGDGGAGGAGDSAVAGGAGAEGAAAGAEQSAGLHIWQQVTLWQQQRRDLQHAEAVSNGIDTINVQTNTICRRRRMAGLLQLVTPPNRNRTDSRILNPARRQAIIFDEPMLTSRIGACNQI
jgi:hypothetical protein